MNRAENFGAVVVFGILCLWSVWCAAEIPPGRDGLPALPASNDAVAHLGTGLKLFDLERYAEAADEFELALKADPRLSDARYHLAVSYFNERRYPEARQQFDRLLATGYQVDFDTYYLGRIDLVEGHVDLAIRRLVSLKRSGPLRDELYYLGSAFMKKGEAEKAIAPLRRQIEFNPRDFRAHNLIARAYLKTGKGQEAEREFQESDRLHQYYLEGKEELSNCRSELTLGHGDQAWEQCGSVLKTDDIDKLVGVGMLFGEFGSYERALQAFQRALELDLESPEVNYNIGLTYFQEKNYPQARQFSETAARLRPDFFEALALEGTVLYLLREDAAALKALDRAHQLRPDDPAVNKLLAQLNKGTSR